MERKTSSKPRAWVWANIHCNVSTADDCTLLQQSTHCQGKGRCLSRKSCFVGGVDRADLVIASSSLPDFAEESSRKNRTECPSKQKICLPQRKSSEPGFARAETPCANGGTRVCGTAVEPNVVEQVFERLRQKCYCASPQSLLETSAFA